MWKTITHASLSRRRTSLSERSLTRTESVVEREHKALAELKELCRKNNVSWPKSELVVAGDSSDDDGNDDSNLLRYLRARKYDVPAAFKQYAASAKWRDEIQLEKTYDDVDITQFETIRRLQPQWTGRRDDTGVPIMVYVVSQVKPEDILALHKMDPALSSVFLAAEYVTQFVQPLCGKLQHRRTTKSINIIDLSHVGIRRFGG
ncbi:CRAL/TRIO, domain-containing protein [Cladophialophora immunda]|nr:CRAL/TRIO, domain-containing protein [Cladophialophora immunda]